MGIRIHRSMGYGLTDVEVDDFTITDDRFNPKGALIADRWGDENKFSFEGFKQHVDDLHNNLPDDRDLFLVRVAMNTDDPWLTSREYDKVINQDTEYGLENVICFTPPCEAKHWNRYDDTIDYYLDGPLRDTNFISGTTINDGMNWCQVLDVPFYPFEGYMDVNTGERAHKDFHHDAYMFRTMEDSIRTEKLEDEPDWVSIAKKQQVVKNILNRIGCEKHWNEKYAPIIPDDLIEYIQYNEIFIDDSTIWQLRPMIYTYWG